MNIKIKDYTLKPCPGAIRLWDVYRTYESTNQETGVKYLSERDIAFGLKLEGAISKIISSEMADKELTVDLAEFIREYKKVKDEIMKLSEL